MPWALVTEDKLTWEWLSHQSLSRHGSFKTLGAETKVWIIVWQQKIETGGFFLLCFYVLFCSTFVVLICPELNSSSHQKFPTVRHSFLHSQGSRLRTSPMLCKDTVFFFLWVWAESTPGKLSTTCLISAHTVDTWNHILLLAGNTWYHTCTQICITPLAAQQNKRPPPSAPFRKQPSREQILSENM